MALLNWTTAKISMTLLMDLEVAALGLWRKKLPMLATIIPLQLELHGSPMKAPMPLLHFVRCTPILPLPFRVSTHTPDQDHGRFSEGYLDPA
jgi:hypothetical protein